MEDNINTLVEIPSGCVSNVSLDVLGTGIPVKFLVLVGGLIVNAGDSVAPSKQGIYEV